LPRKTDSNNPADWLAIAEADMDAVRLLADHQTSHTVCRSKLAEVIEKLMKAELIRLGWRLIKTHNLVHLVNELDARGSDLISVLRPLAGALAEAYFSDRYIPVSTSMILTGHHCASKSRKPVNCSTWSRCESRQKLERTGFWETVSC